MEASTQKAVRKRGLAKVRIQTFTDLVFVWSSQAASDYKKRFRNRFSTSPTLTGFVWSAQPRLVWCFFILWYSIAREKLTKLHYYATLLWLLCYFCFAPRVPAGSLCCVRIELDMTAKGRHYTNLHKRSHAPCLANCLILPSRSFGESNISVSEQV